jgi:methyl-accepting chemotaxis protein
MVSAVLFALAAFCYTAIVAPVSKMQRERGYFTQIADACLQLQLQGERLITADYSAQKGEYASTLSSYYEAIATLGLVKTLPSVNAKLKEAVEAGINLKAESDQSIVAVNSAIEALDADMTEAFGDDSGKSVLDVLSATGTGGNAALRMDAEALVAALRESNALLTQSYATVTAKDSITLAEIAKVEKRSQSVALIIIALLAIIAVGFSLIMARSIANSLSKIVNGISVMASGDFTGRFDVLSKDETGALGRDLERLLETLNQSLSGIQRANGENSAIRQDLVSALGGMSASSNRISGNAESILGKMEELDAAIELSVVKVSNVGSSMSDFDLEVGRQNEQVTQSSAAVTEMIASVENINRLAGMNQGAAQDLVLESDQGRTVLGETFERVGELAANVNSIIELTESIAAVASQTNILAMNAAIEAAHAGEFGRGFAVVADEIAKLAQASAESSEGISATINQMAKKINQASESRDASVSSFDSINAKIKVVSDSIAEISTSIEELQRGNRQILESMEQLRSGSSGIKEESSRIQGETRDAETTMAKIGYISKAVAESIAGITREIEGISDNMRSVSSKAESVGLVGRALDEALNRFKTNDHGEA